MPTNFSQTAAYIWSLADLLRGDFKQSQYGRVILPFTILRRLECVLEATRPKVIKQIGKLAKFGIAKTPFGSLRCLARIPARLVCFALLRSIKIVQTIITCSSVNVLIRL